MAFPHHPWARKGANKDIIRDTFFASIIGYINKRVGVEAYFVGYEEEEGDHRHSKYHTKAEVWEWYSKPGTAMDWSGVRAKDHNIWDFWETDELLMEGDEMFLVVLDEE